MTHGQPAPKDINGTPIKLGDKVRVRAPWSKPDDQPVTFTVGRLLENGVAETRQGAGLIYQANYVEVIS